MVSAKRGGDGGAICQGGIRQWSPRPEALRECDGRVEDDTTLSAGVSPHENLRLVEQTRRKVLDLGGRRGINVERAKKCAERMLLNLCAYIRSVGGVEYG